ncbi:MAG: DUF4920 domain-containing protein [Calditrichaceae bacterium]|nr:DUF4920 domain-containing protein [Calditrichia bacterium]NUQ43421.1 DUF4920 domain-containing protein [Calditrichaceae bacterium]
MKKLFSALSMVLLILLAGCGKDDSAQQSPEHSEAAESAALQKADPAGTYGKAISSGDTVLVSQILETPEAYQGRKVIISGDVVEVCQKRGCWIEVASDKPYQTITVKVNDGEIVFPLSARGSRAVVEGTVERIDLTAEQALKWKAHQAEEKGLPFDSTTVQGPLTIWRIRGLGAEIKG